MVALRVGLLMDDRKYFLTMKGIFRYNRILLSN